MTAEYRHVPVMLAEVLAELDPQPGEVVCDCTLGGAGHTVELAKRVAPDGLSVGIDQDDMALSAATERLAREVPQAETLPLKGNFGDLDELLVEAEVPGVDCFLFDLGVSSPQLDIPERGFSYHEDAPLDMRMNSGNHTLTAAEVVNTYNEADLTHRQTDRRAARQGADSDHAPARGRDQGGDSRGGEKDRWAPGASHVPGSANRGQPRARRSGARPARRRPLGEPGREDLRDLLPLARGPDREARLLGALPGVHLPAGPSGVRVRSRADTERQDEKAPRCV